MSLLIPRPNNRTVAREQQSSKETQVPTNYVSKAATTLEGLIAEDPFTKSTSSESRNDESDEFGSENGNVPGSNGKSNSQVDNHIDVAEDDGLLIIPYKEIPDSWTEAPDILSFRSLDRSFVFPGEQIRMLACLSACKQDTEIITPFKVAAAMNKKGIGQSPKKENGNSGGETNPVSGDQDNKNGETVIEGNIEPQKGVSTGESLLRMEDHKKQTEQLLQRFKTSHFFARIAESNEQLWSKRRSQEASSESFEEKLTGDSSETATTVKKTNPISAAIDRGKFDAHTSGGLARGAVECCSLSNGDVVVLLQVNVGAEFFRDPILEILQFEKYQERNPTLENHHVQTSYRDRDPSGELLKWLLPLDNSIPNPAPRPITPPTLSSSSSIRTTPMKSAVSAPSGSQIFSFGNFRSYSMSSLPPNTTTPPQAVTTPDAKPIFDPEDWNQFSFEKFVESGKSGNEGLLSFRGVPLQRERFSVRCGLEGIFTPGRRWRRKIELIQPVEIRSFSVDCNAEDLLCVHVKNVSPAHAPDIVVFIDAITIVFEEASRDGPPFFLPIACIEAGKDYSLPNLALRRGEEHSFILKPATTMWKQTKGQSESNLQSSRPSGSAADRYAVLASCRCNYTESKLFFKKPTSWRPSISKDLMISVASEMSKPSLGSDGTQLPVQVLTLQASNMTSDNLTLTVLAPASFTSPPSVVSLSNSPLSPLSPFAAASEFSEILSSDRQKVEDSPQSVSVNAPPVPISDVVPNSDMGCTHLWLQSRVPLGCVPSHSTATIKLEVLPLTDGIITLDSLQIDVKEKGLRYIPEHSLKIHATSSIATGIL